MLVLCSVCLHFSVKGQEVIRHFTVEDGLPSSEVYFIHQDINGYMWFCTDRGISRYNGYEFENYTTHNGLSYNTNFKIFEDPGNNLWFTGFDGSLAKWNKEKKGFESFEHNKELKERLGNYNWVYSLSFTGDSTIIFSHSGKDTLFFSDRDPEIRDIDLDETIKVQSGLVGLKKSDTRFENYAYVRLDSAFRETIFPQLGSIVDTLQLKYRILEIGQFDQYLAFCTHLGVLLYDTSTMKQVGHLLPDIEVSSMLRDRENNLWLTTVTKGVYVMSLNDVRRVQLTSMLEDGESLTRMNVIGDMVFMGTNRGRLFNLVTGELLNKMYPASSDIHAIDRVGNKLYISYGQVIDRDGKLKRMKHWEDYKRCYRVIPINDSLIFTTTAMLYGFYKPHEQTNVWNKGRITDATRAPDNSIFFSTNNSLYHMPGEWSDPLGEPEVILELGQVVIRDIVFFEDSLILLGTTGSGLILNRYGSKEVDSIGIAEGLSTDMINAFEIDEINKRIWCATNRGVSIIDYSYSNDSFLIKKITNLNNLHGLPSNFGIDLTIADSFVWIGSEHNVALIPRMFNLDVVAPPRIDIERVTFSGVEPTGGPIQMSYRQNDLKVHFNAFSLQKPLDGYFYRYRLRDSEGQEQDWDYSDERTITFMDLRAGQYVFEVSARSENSEWSEPARLTFTIKPFFFNRLSVQIIGLILIILLITFAVRWRLYNLKKENETSLRLKNLEIQNSKLELETLRGQMNPHFVFNALKSIQKLILTSENDKANKLLTRFSRLMRSSLEYTRTDFIEISKEVEFLRNYLEIELQRTPGRFGYSVEVGEGVMDDMQVPSLLVQPICENAVKHAFVEEKGRIKVTFEHYGPEILQVTVEDTGIGFYNSRVRDSTTQNSVGLEIVRSRLELLRKQDYHTAIEIKPLDPKTMKGTIVSLKIPYK